MTTGTSKSDAADKRVCSGGREFEISNSPLFTLIKAAAAVNPKQFTLPFEMTLPACFLPGEPKCTYRLYMFFLQLSFVKQYFRRLVF